MWPHLKRSALGWFRDGLEKVNRSQALVSSEDPINLQPDLDTHVHTFTHTHTHSHIHAFLDVTLIHMAGLWRLYFLFYVIAYFIYHYSSFLPFRQAVLARKWRAARKTLVLLVNQQMRQTVTSKPWIVIAVHGERVTIKSSPVWCSIPDNKCQWQKSCLFSSFAKNSPRLCVSKWLNLEIVGII